MLLQAGFDPECYFIEVSKGGYDTSELPCLEINVNSSVHIDEAKAFLPTAAHFKHKLLLDLCIRRVSRR